MNQGQRSLLHAGIELLTRSRLVNWDKAAHRFVAPDVNPLAEFSKNGPFGRLMSWILFSVGAEYILKAVCKENDIASPIEKALGIEYPESGDIAEWARRVSARSSGDTVSGAITTDEFYKPLGNYVRSHIRPLAEKLELEDEDGDLLYAGYKLLAVIRNRDVHTYESDVRNSNFRLIGEVFVPCLNLLWQSLPDSTRGAIPDP